MFERSRDISRAYTHPDLDFDEADLLAVDWVRQQHRVTGGPVIIYAPSRASFDGRRHPELEVLRRAGATEATWRTHRHGRGIVLAIAPDAKHLTEVDDSWAATAIIAVAQSHEDVVAWATAKNALLLGGEPERTPALDPVIQAAVTSMGAGHNQNNVLDERSRARIAACLDELRRNGYPLDPDDLYTAALTAGWRGDNAEGVRTIANTLNSGRSVKGMHATGLPPGLIDYWREQATHPE